MSEKISLDSSELNYINSWVQNMKLWTTIHPTIIYKRDSLFTRNLPLRKKATCNCSTHWPTIFSWRES